MIMLKMLVFRVCFICFLVIQTTALNIKIDGPIVRTIDDLESDFVEKDLYEQLQVEVKLSAPHHHSHEDISSEEFPDVDDSFDSWSIVWYIASFGGLIAFFLIVSCSEWCCRKHIREQQARRTQTTAPSPAPSVETPPPAYDLFAPPSYESLNYGAMEKSEYDIYVVPVHAVASLVETNQQAEEDPPSYNSVSQGNVHVVPT